MKKLIFLLSVIIPIALLADSPVSIEPYKPTVGSKIKITYDTDSPNAVITDPQAALSLYALHWYDENDPIFSEHPMRKRRGLWTTTIDHSKDKAARLIQFKIVSESESDNNNGNFWDIVFYTKEGKMSPDSYYLLGRSWNMRPGMVASLSGAEMLREHNQKKAEEYFTQGYKLYPDHVGLARMYIQYAADWVKDSEDPDQLRQEVLSIARHLEEKYSDHPWVLPSIARMHYYLGDEDTYNTYIEKSLERFPADPSSETFRRQHAFDRTISPEERLKRLESFLNDFPTSDFASGAVFQILDAYISLDQIQEAHDWLDSFPHKEVSHFVSFASMLQRQDVSPELLIEVTQKGIDLLTKEPGFHRPTYLTQREWEKIFESDRYTASNKWNEVRLYTISSEAFAKLDNYDRSVVFMDKAYRVSEGEAAHINSQYVRTLYDAGEYDTAIEVGRRSIVQNRSDEELLKSLLGAYIKVHTTDEGFEEFVKKAEEESITYLRKKFSERMISTEAPDFTLVRLDGDPITLSDLSGKVVILDFWATWCGPCIMAFPHFQKVVDHFADNPDVVFLAINTWERETEDERIEKVKNFIEENGYTFTVLLDEDEVVREYGVEGIPTRFALGRDGTVRFKDIGFSGPGMKKDMIVQIELLLEDEPISIR